MCGRLSAAEPAETAENGITLAVTSADTSINYSALRHVTTQRVGVQLLSSWAYNC